MGDGALGLGGYLEQSISQSSKQALMVRRARQKLVDQNNDEDKQYAPSRMKFCGEDGVVQRTARHRKRACRENAGQEQEGRS